MDNTNLKEIEKLIAEINDSAEELRNKKIEIKEKDLPTNLSLMLSGIPNSKAIDFLFSQRLDQLLERLMGLIMSGDLMMNVEKFFTNEEEIEKLFKSMGFGEGSFKGTVSTAVLGTIRDSMESDKYKNASGDLKKVKIIYKKLWLKRFSFIGKPAERKKYDEALRALKQILKVVSKVYKNRLSIIKGLGNIVTESTQEVIQIEAI